MAEAPEAVQPPGTPPRQARRGRAGGDPRAGTPPPPGTRSRPAPPRRRRMEADGPDHPPRPRRGGSSRWPDPPRLARGVGLESGDPVAEEVAEVPRACRAAGRRPSRGSRRSVSPATRARVNASDIETSWCARWGSREQPADGVRRGQDTGHQRSRSLRQPPSIADLDEVSPADLDRLDPAIRFPPATLVQPRAFPSRTHRKPSVNPGIGKQLPGLGHQRRTTPDRQRSGATYRA